MTWHMEETRIITANGQVVTFEYPIRGAREVQGVLVVVLNVPQERSMTENVFAVSADGRLLWQIKPCPTNSGDPAFRYTDIIRADGNTIWIDNTSEVGSAVDVHSGTVWDHENRPTNWRINGKDVMTPSGKTVAFEYPVCDAKEVEGVLVVVLEVPPKVVMTENVFGLSADGRVLWQIEKCDANSTYSANRYVGVTGKVGRTARVFNGNGINSALDVHTGKVSDHRVVK